MQGMKGELEDSEPILEDFESEEIIDTKEGDIEEIEAMKKQLQELQDEATNAHENSKQAEHESHSLDAKEEVDSRSIYVGNVDYSANPEELKEHFASCGTINRVTILCDKFTGHPKGYAYIEFMNRDSVSVATNLNDSVFKGRYLKVVSKRTNVPGVNNRPKSRSNMRGFYPRSRGPRQTYYHPYIN